MNHFPSLDPAVRERLGRLGIDPEESASNLIAFPPPRLLKALRRGPAPRRALAFEVIASIQDGSYLFGSGWAPCNFYRAGNQIPLAVVLPG